MADASTTTDPALLGAWKTTESGDPSVLWIRQKGPLYTIRYDGEDKDGKAESARFEGRLTRVGDAELMDIVSTDEKDFAVAVHMVVRLWPSAGKLKWVYLDSDWLRAQARQALATQPSGGDTLITTPGDPVAQFLKKFGADPRAYSGEPNEWVRK